MVCVVLVCGGKGKVIIEQFGYYIEFLFLVDGEKVVFCKFIGGYLLDLIYLVELGIYVVDFEEDVVSKVIDSGYNVYFVGGDDCVYFIEFVGGEVYYEM